MAKFFIPVKLDTIKKAKPNSASRYEFEYDTKLITCGFCGAEINWSQLESEESILNYSNTVCPECGCWFACDLEFETIKQALERKSLERQFPLII